MLRVRYSADYNITGVSMKQFLSTTRQKRIVFGVITGLVVALSITSYTVTTGVMSQTAPETAVSPQPVTEFTYVATAGTSVLTQLDQIADVKTQESEFGAFVDSINGTKGGTDGKYWLYFVNGESATTSADSYITKGGEKIEWKLTK